MSVTTVHTDQAAPSLRGLLPVWVGAAVYALLVLAGNRLLIDPDTLWQITVGQWIIDHRAVPTEDVYSFTMRGEPWISTQWLAQVMYAKAFAVAGWAGPVVLASGCDRRDLCAAGALRQPPPLRQRDAGLSLPPRSRSPCRICWRGRMCWRCRCWWRGPRD